MIDILIAEWICDFFYRNPLPALSLASQVGRFVKNPVCQILCPATKPEAEHLTDPANIIEFQNILRKRASSSGTTMLTGTHEMNFARDFAGQVRRMTANGESTPGPGSVQNPRQTATVVRIRYRQAGSAL